MGKRKKNQTSGLEVFMGETCKATGVLKLKGQGRLDGRFEGDINGEKGMLVIGPQSRIKAEITTGVVIIRGRMEGNVSAKERIELEAPGRLKGQVVAPNVVVHEGAFIDGNVNMTDPEEKVAALEPLAERD